MIGKSDSEYEEGSYVASNDGNYIPAANGGTGTPEVSNIEQEMIIEQEEEYDSDEIVEDKPLSQNVSSIWTAKGETKWGSNPVPNAQTRTRNILRQRSGPAATTNLFAPDQLFKSIMRPKICDITLRETNRKGERVWDAFNNDLLNRFPFSFGGSPSKTFQPFTEAELLAFIGILFAAGVHRQNKENLDDMWNGDALPLIRAAMSRDRFKMMLGFIRFDNKNTRTERVQTDKAASTRGIWIMLNRNLEKAYKPYECITIDQQLFPFRGHTKFTQYIPSKPAKYGIKVFWACDALKAYPLQDQIYTGKRIDSP